MKTIKNYTLNVYVKNMVVDLYANLLLIKAEIMFNYNLLFTESYYIARAFKNVYRIINSILRNPTPVKYLKISSCKQ